MPGTEREALLLELVGSCRHTLVTVCPTARFKCISLFTVTTCTDTKADRRPMTHKEEEVRLQGGSNRVVEEAAVGTGTILGRQVQRQKGEESCF